MLKDSLPQFVREMREMAVMLHADQKEIDRLEASIEEMEKQFWIASATYSLDDWEKEFGIEKNSMLSTQQCRAQVLAKLNTRAPSSVKMIKNLVIKVLGEKRVEVEEHYGDYSFTVIIKSDCVLKNMLIAVDAVHKARPAHLNYVFVNKIEKETLLQMHLATAERKIKDQEAEADTRRRKLVCCIGCHARHVKVQEGDVEMIKNVSKAAK